MTPTLAAIQAPNPGRQQLLESPDSALAGPEGIHAALVSATLARHGFSAVSRGEPIEVTLASRSRIVAANGDQLWCVLYPGLAGLFRKNTRANRVFGRTLCDDVRRRFDCGGFFTSDELPRYGVSEGELEVIRSAVGSTGTDCVAIYAYSKSLAGLIDDYVYESLRRLAPKRSVPPPTRHAEDALVEHPRRG